MSDEQVQLMKGGGGSEKRREPEPSTSEQPSASPERRRRRGYKEVDPVEPVDLPEGEDEIAEGERRDKKKQ